MALRGIDGKMLSVVIKETVGFETLAAEVGQWVAHLVDDRRPPYFQGCDCKAGHVPASIHPALFQAHKPFWMSLLDRALTLGVHALLDCGALLVGVSIR